MAKAPRSSSRHHHAPTRSPCQFYERTFEMTRCLPRARSGSKAIYMTTATSRWALLENKAEGKRRPQHFWLRGRDHDEDHNRRAEVA